MQNDVAALTLEEVKSFNKGTWLWIIDLGDGESSYYQIDHFTETDMVCNYGKATFDLSFYGECFIAYRNKEEAEGLSVTLPCKKDQSGWVVDKHQEFVGFDCKTSYTVHKTVACNFIYMNGKMYLIDGFNDCFDNMFKTQKEATEYKYQLEAKDARQ